MIKVEENPDGGLTIILTEEEWEELQQRLEEPARELPRLREMLNKAEVWRDDEQG